MKAFFPRPDRLTAEGLLYGPALDTIVVTGTAIGATLAAGTVASGDNLQIKNTNGNSKAWLLQTWQDNQVAGMQRIRSPKFHDNIDGLRQRVLIGTLDPLFPDGVKQVLYPQDQLIVELAGSAVAGDIESAVLQIYYEDLPGQSARLSTWEALLPKIIDYVTVRLALTIGSTAGYNGARAINADTDFLQANTDYAVLGITGDVETAAVTLKGPDTGNLRVAVPGETTLWHLTNSWFKRLAMSTGLPLIPIINSANKGATQLEVVGDENGGTFNATIFLARLGK